MAFDVVLAERVRKCFPPADDVVEKKMFGGLTFMYKGHMCCGVSGTDRLMLRVPKESYQDILKRKHVVEMDFTGRTLKGFVYVEKSGLKTDASLQEFVEIARQAVEQLPERNKRK